MYFTYATCGFICNVGKFIPIWIIGNWTLIITCHLSTWVIIILWVIIKTPKNKRILKKLVAFP